MGQPNFDYTYKLLMNQVKHKHEHLQQELLRDQAAAPSQDPLMARQTQVQKIGREVKRIHGQNCGGRGRNGDRNGGGRYGSNSGRGRSGRGNQNRNNRDRDPSWRPFSAELRNKPAPTDPSVPVIFDGVEYWYCTKHNNWGRHSTAACRKGQAAGSNTGNDSGSPSHHTGGGQNRTVQALAAIARLGSS